MHGFITLSQMRCHMIISQVSWSCLCKGKWQIKQDNPSQKPEDQWSFKRSPDFFPVKTTTVKREKGQHQFFRCSRAANSVVHDQIWPNFKLIKALIYVIITCKYEKDLIKNSWEKKATSFFPNISLWGFFRRSRAANSPVGGPIRPKIEILWALIHVIVSCKYGKERMKNSREKMETLFFPS